MKFTDFGFNENVLKGIVEAGFTDCTPVQEQTYNNVLKEARDITVQSQTGTGKTAAFLISIFEMMLADSGRKKALIVAPTRELAVQIEEEAKILGKYLPFKPASFYGGVGYNLQEKNLREGADILIGTPGRLLDLNKSGKLVLKDVDIFIIDEADRLFDMGFLPELKRILRNLPPREKRLTMLFSATLSNNVRNIAWEYQNNPSTIEIAPEKITVEEITQELYHVSRSDKVSLLLGLLHREKPETVLLFSNTKHGAVRLAKRLSHNGFPCEYIMGDLPQKKRLSIINNLKAGNVKFLVATDVAARGLHIDNLDLVINFDIPEDCENYVHRIGRTARAGKSGKAISLACEKYVFGLQAIEAFTGMKIPVVWPVDSDYVKDKSAGMSFSEERYSRGHSKGKAGSQRSGSRGRPDRNYSRRNPGTGRGGQRKSTDIDPRRTAALQSEITKITGGKSRSKPIAGQRTEQKKRDRKPVRKQHPEKREYKRSAAPVRKANPERKIRPGTKGQSLDDRLAYYKEKYGEDFKAPQEVILADKENSKDKKTLVGRLKGVFGKRK